MNAAGKALLVLLMLLAQGAAYLLLWDGDVERMRAAREAASGRASWASVVELRMPKVAREQPLTAPLEFFDLVERNYPAAFARNFEPSTMKSMGAMYREARDLGRDVYVREGCIHCHTQVVRTGARDIERWGAPSRLGAANVRVVGLPLTGLRRVGPDLANEGGLRSNDWHAAHLLKPQALLKGSIMPSYPWLFEEVEGRMEPTKEGLALIMYLQSLNGENGVPPSQ